jgi:hypothetical protein
VSIGRGIRYWTNAGRWLRAVTLWWPAGLLCLLVGTMAGVRLLQGGVALSWRGMREEEDSQELRHLTPAPGVPRRGELP